MNKTLILASKSPRRQQLLQQLQLDFQTVSPDIDESLLRDEKITSYAKRIAIEKAQAGYQKFLNNFPNIEPLILAADTCGEVDGQLLGKPVDYEDAYRLLRLLSGSEHLIHTSFALFDGKDLYAEVVTSAVAMKPLTDDEILRYWQTGEPQDKAGAYAIQGLGAQFITHLSGSYSAVMGLPLFELSQALSAYHSKIG